MTTSSQGRSRYEPQSVADPTRHLPPTWRLDSHPDIERSNTVFEHDERVDVQFLNLRTEVNERREPQQRVTERGFIRRLRAPVAAQQPGAAKAVDHCRRVALGQRMETEL